MPPSCLSYPAFNHALIFTKKLHIKKTLKTKDNEAKRLVWFLNANIASVPVYAICESSAEDKSEMLQEFEAVLNMSLASDSLYATRPPKEKSVGHDIKWLATQTLFSILDHMNKWLRKKYMSIMSNHRRLEDPEVLTSKDKVRFEKKLYLIRRVDWVSELQAGLVFKWLKVV